MRGSQVRSSSYQAVVKQFFAGNNLPVLIYLSINAQPLSQKAFIVLFFLYIKTPANKLPNLTLKKDGKRDRWNGYDNTAHTEVVDEFKKMDDVKKEIR